jgi:hypothetical protein
MQTPETNRKPSGLGTVYRGLHFEFETPDRFNKNPENVFDT